MVMPVHAEIPAGYYNDADGLNKEELLDALNTITSSGNFLSYGSGEHSTWEGFYYTDRNEDGTVIDMYSDIVRTQDSFDAVEGMHIEHSFPKSWWGGTEINAYRDLYHLYPADGDINTLKNNLPLGVVGTATTDNGVSKIGDNVWPGATGNCFEPADEYKGDFARSYFYIVTAYNEMEKYWQSPMTDNNSYPVWRPWAIDLLLQWHRQDPVSEKELRRIEAVYAIQGNRNPYIDYPELAEYIWGKDTANVFTLPEDSRPYLSKPDRWTKIDAGVAMTGVAQGIEVAFKGGNLTDGVTLSILHSTPGISLSRTTLTGGEISSGTSVTVTFISSGMETLEDTLIVTSSATGELRIPMSASFTDQFMLYPAGNSTATTAAIEWMEMPGAESYTIEWQRGGASVAGDLIISSYIEGSNWNKAIEFYNGTGKDVDLGYYSLRKQNNGTGNFSNDTRLSGTIKPGETYLLVHGSASAALRAKADTVMSDDYTNVLSFNGNDAVALYHNGILTDLVGAKDNPDYWGQDITLIRKPEVTHPSATFLPDEWETEATDYMDHTGHHTMTFIGAVEQGSVTTEGTTYTLTGLIPEEQYIISVTANPLDIRSCNAISFMTAQLSAPEAYGATDIRHDRFTANWDIVAEADGYLLDVFTVEDKGSFTVEEHFDSVGAKGTPLPDGWSGTASGNYTTTTSSGENPPSVKLQNDMEYIQTPLYPADIQSLSFMYKFTTKGGSYLIIDGYGEDGTPVRIDSIAAENTSKSTASYTADRLRGCQSVRWTYHKDKGNIAIDDVCYSAAHTDTTFIYEGLEATANSLTVTGLERDTEYLYRVRAFTGESLSPYSATIAVTTAADIVEATEHPDTLPLTVYTSGHTAHITGIAERTLIEVYTVTGQTVYSGMCNGDTKIRLPHTGIYIIRATVESNFSIYKVIVR